MPQGTDFSVAYDYQGPLLLLPAEYSHVLETAPDPSEVQAGRHGRGAVEISDVDERVVQPLDGRQEKATKPEGTSGQREAWSRREENE